MTIEFKAFVMPLTEEHLNEINNALSDGELAQKHIEMAKRAGIDVSQHEAQHTENMQKLRQIKQVYFPNRS
jgi:hypothetical protein